MRGGVGARCFLTGEEKKRREEKKSAEGEAAATSQTAPHRQHHAAIEVLYPVLSCTQCFYCSMTSHQTPGSPENELNDRFSGHGRVEVEFGDGQSLPSSSPSSGDELINTPDRCNHDGDSLSDGDSSVDDTPQKPRAMKTALGKLPAKLKETDFTLAKKEMPPKFDVKDLKEMGLEKKVISIIEKTSKAYKAADTKLSKGQGSYEEVYEALETSNEEVSNMKKKYNCVVTEKFEAQKQVHTLQKKVRKLKKRTKSLLKSRKSAEDSLKKEKKEQKKVVDSLTKRSKTMASKLEHAIKQRDNLDEELKKKKADDKADASSRKHLMELEKRKKAAELDMQKAQNRQEMRERDRQSKLQAKQARTNEAAALSSCHPPSSF